MSSKSVAIKLGIKKDASVLSVGPPAGHLTSIGVLPPEDRTEASSLDKGTSGAWLEPERRKIAEW